MAKEQAKEVWVQYQETPEPTVEGESFRLRLATDGIRAQPRLVAQLHQAGVVRDALLTMGEVVSSDLRFKARDRADYLAYLLKQGKQASMELWNAQKEFLEDKYGEAEDEEAPLDPVVTVGSDGLAIEVFSADESSYARLHIDAGSYQASESISGSTHLPFTPQLLRGLERMRSYRDSVLEIGPSQGGEKRKVMVPYRWIRAFGQMQAASTLPAQTFEVAPVDLYNVLLTLKRQKAKTSPRALRYELVPGEVPRVVLEPWELVLRGSGGAYQGKRAQVVRTWGRNRLMVLSKVLPHAKRVWVRLVGPGLPAYYVLELEGATLTLALSGWTDSGWAGISTFDLLVPTDAQDELPKTVRSELEKGPLGLDALIEITGRERAEVRNAVLLEMQRGHVIHDVGAGLFLRRSLFADALDVSKLRYRDQNEADAHRLLEKDDQVVLTKVHDLGGQGVRIEGEVHDHSAHRVYQTSFTLDREGRTVDATCTSPQFKRSGLREGPTTPMIALRLRYARQQAELERARGTEEGRKMIRAETRTFIKRRGDEATTYRLSLDDKLVVVRWGTNPDHMRMHRMRFNKPEEARDEYFVRIERLSDKGFIDASAAEVV